MTKKKILTKTMSIVLVLATVFSMFAITANAASYSTGKYVIVPSNGLNVRPNPNSSSRVGAASRGVEFEVTQVSENWGYTPSIKCTNGTRSGWVCLDYCSFKGSSHTHNYNGDRYYESAHPHEISVRCTSYNSCGGWKWTGETYKVKDCPQCYPTSKAYYTLTYNANGGSNAPSSQRVEANKIFKLSTQKPSRSGYTFLGWSSNKNATASSYAPGTSVRLNGNATIYAVWQKNQTANYPTGIYAINSSSGSNVRSGAGTNYSKLGAAKYGTVFTVTQVKGSWGYASIQCTNGVKKGWVCLDYCTYKGNNYTPASNIKLNVPLYKQTDSRWSSVKIGTKTIGQIGCTTTCIAMVYSYNTGTTVYPHQVKNRLRYQNNDLYWNSIGNVGLTSISYSSAVTNSMLKTIYNKLKEGRPVIIGACVPGGASQHWVVITGYTGMSTTNFSTADFTINDPGYQNSTTLKAFLANGSGADRTNVIRIVY